MGPDLHRPQPHQARQGCLNRLSFMKTAEPQTYVDRLLALTQPSGSRGGATSLPSPRATEVYDLPVARIHAATQCLRPEEVCAALTSLADRRSFWYRSSDWRAEV